MLTALISGFGLGLGLIVAIGAQNAFVLRQGLRREHVLAVTLTCALSDAVLIGVGVLAFRTVSNAMTWLDPVMRAGGFIFLAAYGLRAFIAAWRGSGGLDAADYAPKRLGEVLATCLAFTWLNPHVYLDTVVLTGSLSTGYPGFEMAFAAGAMFASLLFFLALGYGARLLQPVFRRPQAWRLLDGAIGAVMLTLAVRLII